MKIAVDARELAGRPTGVGRYLSELLARWGRSRDATRHEWQLYTASPAPPETGGPAEVTMVPGDGGTWWEQFALPRALARARPDVLFAPGYTAPLTAPCPTALTIHDVSFAAHPEWFSFREGVRRRTLTAWSARRARVVLTDSSFSRDEIGRHFGIPAAKVRVIPLGFTRHVAAPASGGRGERSAPREPLILFVGSIFRRRHVDRIIDGFIRRVAPAVPGSRLDIVGDDRTYPPLDVAAALRECPPEIRERVALRSYVDEAALRDLYARAAVFVFPSEYEGFGLTPLDALAAGVPPVVLDTPIAREIYGPAARYVGRDPGDPTALGDALVDLLVNPAARAAILQHADAVLSRYDWDRTADATLRAIEEAAGV